MSFKIDELFYELDARTAGFERNISHAQTSVGNFATFIATKPMLATAALGAAIVAVGAAAVVMAEHVDVSMRKIEAALPGAEREFDKLRQTFEDLAAKSPRTQAELAEAASLIAQKGVKNVAEIQQRLKIAVDLADATGAELGTVIEGLDTVGDAFQISATQAADAMTRIFGAAQGKVGLDEVIATLARGGSVLHALGVEAADAGEAMVALIDAGIPRRQAGTVLTTILELTNRVRALKAAGGEQAEVGKIIEQTLSRQNVQAKGLAGALGEFAAAAEKSGRDLSEYGLKANTVNAIERVAKAAHDDTRTAVEKQTDAMKRLQAAADVNRSSAGALWQRIQNELNTSLIRLGNEILPHLLPLLTRFVELLREARGIDSTPEGELQQKTRELGIRAAIINEQAKAGQIPRDTGALQKFIDNPRLITTPALNPQELDYINRYKAVLELQRAINGEAPPAGGASGPNIPALTNDIINAVAMLRRSVASVIAGETLTQIDDARARVAAFREEVAQLEKKAGRTFADLRAEGDRLDKGVGVLEGQERAAAAKSVAGEVAQALGLQSRVMEQGLKDFLADVDKRNAEYAKLGLAPLFSPEQVATVRELRQALIDTTRAAEEADAAITKSRATPGGRADTLFLGISAIQKEQAATTGDSAQAVEKRRRLQEQINKLQAELNSLVAQENTLHDKETAKLVQHTKMLQDQANAINTAVGYALQLGTAFGIVSANTAGILQSLAGAASSIGPLLDGIKNLHSGAKDSAGNPLSTLSGVLGQAAPIIGAVTSIAGMLFGGPSPEELERRRLLKENNTRLAELNSSVGDLARISVTGTDVAKYGPIVSNPALDRLRGLTSGGAITADTINRQLGALLDAAGVSTAQLKAFAQSFGITVGTGPGGKLTVADFDNLRKAMQASELTQFATTFTGQLQEMDAEIHLFDLKEPTKQLELFRRALDNMKNGGGILQATLDNFDTSTAEGVAAAQKAIQDLFAQLQAGTLNPEQLGGLTAQEFLDALLKASDLLRGVASGGTLGTGGFNVSQQITEVTGSRLAAIASSSQIFLQQIAENTARLALALTGSATLPPIGAPAFPGGGAAGGIIIGDIIVQIDSGGLLDDARAAALGQRVGGGIVDSLNRALGNDLLWRRRGKGDINLA